MCLLQSLTWGHHDGTFQKVLREDSVTSAWRPEGRCPSWPHRGPPLLPPSSLAWCLAEAGPAACLTFILTLKTQGSAASCGPALLEVQCGRNSVV